MGEVVLSSDRVERSEAEKASNRAEFSTATKNDAMAIWERFLPKMKMRVLLVEADDSTRHIITALLRKCSYRVAAVADGLKAWELLKGRPHCVDLILTEVDLPSISGFPLLTLIMEHEICKDIPVIMMSSEDSISTVYRCMTRGAADYLVKPIRKNELSNLWQHVWRRKASNANGVQDESVAQRKVEDAFENDAASNESNGNTECLHRNDENADKGSDAQSSCTKPGLEVECIHVEKSQEFSKPTQEKSLQSGSRTQEDYDHINQGAQVHISTIDAKGTFEDTDVENVVVKGFEPENLQRECSNKSSEARETNNFSFNLTGEAIDLNGLANDTPPNCKYQNSSSSNVTSKFEYTPTLDLTLRSNSGGFENHISEQRSGLGRSNSSAFSRYINRPLQPLNQASANAFDQVRSFGTKVDTPGASLSPPKSGLTLATGQSEPTNYYSPQQRLFPLPVPVKRVRLNNNNPCPGNGSSSVFCSQSGSSPMPGPSSVAYQESPFPINTLYQANPERNKPEQLYNNAFFRNAAEQATHNNQDHVMDSFEDRDRISPNTDQSASSSFCNGNAFPTHFTNLGYGGSACGSNSNADQLVALVMPGSENRNEEAYFASNGSSQRSMQREAALMKFRMKRKDRCFEKKVRYESRKKLAEQRPRVKGQFVRQGQNNPSFSEIDGDS